jgi:uncharacterized repeat protein (TIGR03987 family)
MNPTLIAAMVTILLAALLYTIAVFSERSAGLLRPWHLLLFWTGFAFDTTGTTLMSVLAGAVRLDIHGLLGAAAILLMLFHSTWATVALRLKQERVLRNFHRFSVVVWALWMVALVTGFAISARRHM